MMNIDSFVSFICSSLITSVYGTNLTIKILVSLFPNTVNTHLEGTTFLMHLVFL